MFLFYLIISLLIVQRGSIRVLRRLAVLLISPHGFGSKII